MNLDEWLKSRRKSRFSKELSERQKEAGITDNPADYYFIVYLDPEGRYDMNDKKFVPRAYAAITPRKYFDEKGYWYDGHLLGFVDVPGFAEDMEAVISPAAGMPDLSCEDMHNILLELGFVFDEKMAKYLEDPYIPSS